MKKRSSNFLNWLNFSCKFQQKFLLKGWPRKINRVNSIRDPRKLANGRALNSSYGMGRRAKFLGALEAVGVSSKKKIKNKFSSFMQFFHFWLRNIEGKKNMEDMKFLFRAIENKNRWNFSFASFPKSTVSSFVRDILMRKWILSKFISVPLWVLLWMCVDGGADITQTQGRTKHYLFLHVSSCRHRTTNEKTFRTLRLKEKSIF